MVQGFDFGLDLTGELMLDKDSSLDIQTKSKDELRLQLAYDRIKSVSTNWFVDNIGADLESLIGKPCNVDTAESGKTLIGHQLTFDKLWEEEEFFIRAQINSNTEIEYNIFFKIKDEETEDIYSKELVAVIDLIKGVHIRYGWRPRRNDSFEH